MAVMKKLSFVFILLVACLHIGFLVLEMYLWQQPFGLKVFGMTPEEAAVSAKLAKNQGLYNGFLAVGLIWGVFENRFDIKIFFLSCVIIAGGYGAATVGIKILFVQALPAWIAMLLTIGAKKA